MYKQLSYDEKNDVITMDFMCFGTDSQAIRIESILNVRYTIRFHKTESIIEESYIMDIEYDVPFNSEIINGKEFAGWGRTPSSLVELKYKTKFRNVGKKGEVIDFYPIYEEYIYDVSDSTIFTLKPTQKQLYFNGGIIDEEIVQVDYDAVIESMITVESKGTPVIISNVGINNDKQIIIDWDYNDFE